MYRRLAVLGLLVLATTACHTATAATPRLSVSAAEAAATPSLSVPGTHTSVATYRIASPVSTLVVTSHVGNITVAGSDRSDVSITEQVAYSSTAPSTTRTLAGRTLTVGYSCHVQLACGVAYIIDVPDGVTVQAATGTGAIHLSGLAGSLTAKTDVGYIDASGLRCAAATLTAHAGGIDATFAAPPSSVTASTDAGGVTLHVPASFAYHVTTHDLVGKATVSVPQAAGSSRSLSARTDLGTILITA